MKKFNAYLNDNQSINYDTLLMMINLLALWIMDHLVVHIIEHLIEGRNVITVIMVSWYNEIGGDYRII